LDNQRNHKSTARLATHPSYLDGLADVVLLSAAHGFEAATDILVALGPAH
jgi:hypothetical protein